MVAAHADWVQHYADMEVGGIHMYAVAGDFILSPQGGGYMHRPGSYRALSVDHHRLLRWKVFHPSPWSLHYYGQVRQHCPSCKRQECFPLLMIATLACLQMVNLHICRGMLPV